MKDKGFWQVILTGPAGFVRVEFATDVALKKGIDNLRKAYGIEEITCFAFNKMTGDVKVIPGKEPEEVEVEDVTQD